jgi:DNA polymerase-1
VQTISTPDGPLHIVRTLSDAASCWDWLDPYARAETDLGLDAEYNAHNHFSPTYRLRTVQMSDGHDTFVIHHERPELAGVVKTLVRHHPRWAAHYAESDIRSIHIGCPGAIRLDSIVPHVRDTQTALAYYDPRTVTGGAKLDPRIRLDRGLKPTVTRVLGSTTLAEAERALMARFREIAPPGVNSVKAVKRYGFEHIPLDDEIYNIYAGLDAVKEIQLFRKMMAEIYRRGQGPIVELDLGRQWHVDLMTLRGMPVDIEYVKWLDDQLEQVVRDNMVRLCEHKVAISGIGPSVGKAFEALDVRSTRETKSGGDSWDAMMLEQIIENAPLATTPRHFEAIELAKAISLVRKSGKFRAAYIAPMLASADRDGRVHCSMRMCGAVTGRNSAADPAVQQMPKRKDKRVRPAFVAPPGWVIVTCDFAQGEPRVMAALSGDLQLQQDIEMGDFNNAVATLTYGTRFIAEQGHDAEFESYQLRQQAKFAFLAWCYGCGLLKLASLLRVGMDAVRQIRDNWVGRYPALQAFREECNALPSVTLTSGRVVPLWDRWEYTHERGGMVRDTGKPSRLGLNAATQGEQADLLRQGFDEFVARGWSWALLMLVHDEIVTCVPEALAEQCRDTLKECMSITFKGFPIRCEAEIVGSSWMKRPSDYNPADLGELMMEVDEDVFY